MGDEPTFIPFYFRCVTVRMCEIHSVCEMCFFLHLRWFSKYFRSLAFDPAMLQQPPIQLEIFLNGFNLDEKLTDLRGNNNSKIYSLPPKIRLIYSRLSICTQQLHLVAAENCRSHKFGAKIPFFFIGGISAKKRIRGHPSKFEPKLLKLVPSLVAFGSLGRYDETLRICGKVACSS